MIPKKMVNLGHEKLREVMESRGISKSPKGTNPDYLFKTGSLTNWYISFVLISVGALILGTS